MGVVHHGVTEACGGNDFRKLRVPDPLRQPKSLRREIEFLADEIVHHADLADRRPLQAGWRATVRKTRRSGFPDGRGPPCRGIILQIIRFVRLSATRASGPEKCTAVLSLGKPAQNLEIRPVAFFDTPLRTHGRNYPQAGDCGSPNRNLILFMAWRNCEGGVQITFWVW